MCKSDKQKYTSFKISRYVLVFSTPTASTARDGSCRASSYCGFCSQQTKVLLRILVWNYDYFGGFMWITIHKLEAVFNPRRTEDHVRYEYKQHKLNLHSLLLGACEECLKADKITEYVSLNGRIFDSKMRQNLVWNTTESVNLKTPKRALKKCSVIISLLF